MPYTPPSQRLPATSNPSSPILSRSRSYVERPPLSRSSSYLNKHRRSPYISNTNNTATNCQISDENVTASAHSHHSHGSSAPSSLPDIDLERGQSPNCNGAADTSASSLTSTTPTRTSSTEARKISHFCSSSESTLAQHAVPPLKTDPIANFFEGGDAKDELGIKPPLPLKKSGELVQPALRPSSRRRTSKISETPTYAKVVHFEEENIEQIRHFFQVDRPIAISTGSAPVETFDSKSEYPLYDDHRSKREEWEIELTNFPTEFERQMMPVRVERIFLAPDYQTLVGMVACAKIASQKLVVCRFTLDNWKTTSEVVAECNDDVRKKQTNENYDQFIFNIKLADQTNLASKTLLLCVRYNANGQDYWDNNASMSYQVDFIKKAKQKGEEHSAGALSTISCGRHSPFMPGSFDDDFGRGIPSDSFRSSVLLKPNGKRGSLFPGQHSHRQATGQAFSSRYDFNASLSAALLAARSADLSNTQNTLGNHSAKLSPGAAAIPSTQHHTLVDKKPGLESVEYNELLQRFCFVRIQTSAGRPK
jgi:hypothetical protein